jgi:predicted Zn-dependent protease
LRINDPRRASAEMQTLLAQAPDSSMVAVLNGRTKSATGDVRGAMEFYAVSMKRFPRNRALVYEYARLLIDNKKGADALRLTTAALSYTHNDSRLYRMQAESFAATGQKLQQHRAQAEAYALMGSLPAAIDQLQIGLKSGDGDFYQLSSAEARLKELRALDAEQRREQRR